MFWCVLYCWERSAWGCLEEEEVVVGLELGSDVPVLAVSPMCVVCGWVGGLVI